MHRARSGAFAQTRAKAVDQAAAIPYPRDAHMGHLSTRKHRDTYCVDDASKRDPQRNLHALPDPFFFAIQTMSRFCSGGVHTRRGHEAQQGHVLVSQNTNDSADHPSGTRVSRRNEESLRLSVQLVNVRRDEHGTRGLIVCFFHFYLDLLLDSL